MLIRHDKQYNTAIHAHGTGRNEYNLLSAAALCRWLHTWAYTPNAKIVAEGNYTRQYTLTFGGHVRTITIKQADANLMRDGL